MTRGRKPEGTPKTGQAIYVRLPDETVEELDAWVTELRTTVPGGSGISRSDVIRDVVVKAMEERSAKRTKAKR